jgi:endonuclease/exonuclease/phosphatase family metal-dependent hydrolase
MVSALLASGACFYWWVDTGFTFNTPVVINESEDHSTYKTLLWNTFRGRGGWDKIAAEIAECKADLVVLNEADTDTKRPNFWSEKFPAHQVQQFKNSILVISRGAIKNVTFGNLAEYSHFARFETTFGNKNCAVYVVDFYSGPFNSRRSAFEQLNRLVSRDYYLPVIVLGDFNTPEESYFFDDFRKRKFKHAFSSTGSGMKATWPVPCPFLDLDHAWVSSKIRLLDSKLGWSALSDHRPLIFEFDFNEEQLPTLWAKLLSRDKTQTY